MRNIAFETLIYMERKQIRLNTAIQKRYTKKENNGKLDTKRIQEDRQKRHAREVFRGEIRRAFMSGWKQGVQYGQDLKEPPKEVDEVLQGKRDRAQSL